MALVVEITIKINRSYQNLSEISPNIITLHLLEFQELFLEHEGVTFFSFIHHINIKLWIVFILFSFIGKLIPFLKILKRKKEYGNDSNQSTYVYNFIFVDVYNHLPLSLRKLSEIFIRRGIENKIKLSHRTMARNLDEESRGRPSSRSRASRKQTWDKWAEGIVDKAVEISGRIIGVRLNWLDREWRQMALRENQMEKFLSLPSRQFTF